MQRQNEQKSQVHQEMAKQYVTFQVGDLNFGVDVEQVQEVLRYQPMTPIPLSPPAVKGLVNLRGQIITAIDVRSLLGMSASTSGKKPMNVVIRAEGEVVSLLVDSIGDVMETDESDFEDTPDTISGDIRAIVQGVFKLKGRLLLVLDGSACVQGERIQ
jgi:purine-binding chemotaxis protein CheW